MITWARTFPAVPAQVREARRFLAGLLDGGPAAGDALICLSELVSNAVVHSRSSQPGGTFTVRVRLAGQRLRVEVSDQGGPWHSPGQASTVEPNGRGLLHRQPTRHPVGLRRPQPHRLDRLVRAGHQPVTTETFQSPPQAPGTHRVADSFMRTGQPECFSRAVRWVGSGARTGLRR